MGARGGEDMLFEWASPPLKRLLALSLVLAC